MISVRRCALASPFAIAAILTVLMICSDLFHSAKRQRIDSYGFAFATPWAWLIEQIPIDRFQNRTLESIVLYLFLLWLPACLYSLCLGLLYCLFRLIAGSRAH